MSLETVVEDIREQARERAAAIRAEAEAEAEQIVAEAEADAEDIIAEAEREAEREVERERDQQLSSATLEAKQRRLEARRDELEAVHDDVEAELAHLSGDQREELTRELLEAAATEFEGEETVSVHGRAEDRELIEDILDEYDGYEFAGEHDCLGGVVVQSEGTRLRVNNTFDSVLEEVWEEQLKDISTRLFES